MTDYKKIMKKINSFKDWTEEYEYCKKVFSRIEAEEKKEFELLTKILPNGRSAYAVAVENGEIEYSEAMEEERLKVWKKCREIIHEYEFTNALFSQET